MKSIRDWLNDGRDWSVGVALYKCHGHNEQLQEMFAQGHSEFRFKRLLKEMQELLNSNPVEAVDIPVETAPVVVSVGAAVMPESVTPAKEDPYRDQWLPLYAEMNSLRHRLIDAQNVAERGEMAFKILGLERKCMRIWEMKDYYLRTGEKFKEEDVADISVGLDINMLTNKRNNLRTYISRTEKALKAKPEDPALQAKLDKWKAELEIIENAMKNG